MSQKISDKPRASALENAVLVVGLPLAIFLAILLVIVLAAYFPWIFLAMAVGILGWAVWILRNRDIF